MDHVVCVASVSVEIDKRLMSGRVGGQRGLNRNDVWHEGGVCTPGARMNGHDDRCDSNFCRNYVWRTVWPGRAKL